jgi:hypothetical protein
LAAGSTAYPALIEPRAVEISHVNVLVRGLPAAFDGLTIAHLTDLHRSRYVSLAYLDECIETVNRLQPDLIAFTGDYLSHGRRLRPRGRLIYGDPADAHGYAREVAECVGRARARHGVFASLGNHDHWYNAGKMTELIERAGVPVLRNAGTTVRVNGATLPVVGLGDFWMEGIRENAAFAGRHDPFALVLMHNPDYFENWVRPGAHLILAGHTHGGQVNVPFVGPPIVPSFYGAKYASGMFQRGDAQMYVSRGVGLIWPPVRFNCRPEIARLRLQSA